MYRGGVTLQCTISVLTCETSLCAIVVVCAMSPVHVVCTPNPVFLSGLHRLYWGLLLKKLTPSTALCVKLDVASFR